MCRRPTRSSTLLLLLTLLLAGGCSRNGTTTWFAIEQGGRQIGYASTTVTPGDSTSGDSSEITTHIALRWTLLGGQMDMNVHETQYRDPVTGDVRDIEGAVEAGPGGFGGTFHFTEDEILVTSTAVPDETRLPREAGLVVDDGLDYRYIVAALEGAAPGTERTWRILDTSQGQIVERVSRLVGEETVLLDAGEFDCLVVENSFISNGASGRLWLDRETGLPVQTLNSDGIRTYLSDAGARLRVTRGDLDALLLAPVPERIEPVEAIRHMKVKARIRTIGEVVTPGSLQQPGQTFEGTVEGNVIDGVFEVAHMAYDPADTPPYPSPEALPEELARWTRPTFLIESEAPEIAAKSAELVDGIQTRWEVIQRIGRWVDTEVADEILGRSALQCLQTMSGECGAHSRLFIALLRAAGIPARQITGGAYFIGKTPAFGQHVWIEVHMGEAGWIPLDATFGEVDVLDSGHIRVGSNTTFYPLAMEILEYGLAGPEGDRP